MNYEVGLYH